MGVGRSERGPDDKPLADLWAVVGGKETGGIVVREGASMDSKELGERLSTGALISAKAKIGNRLHYTMISGTGPQSGWVSIRMQCQDLLVRMVTAGGPKELKKPMLESQDAMELALAEAKKMADYQSSIGVTEPEPKGPLELSKAACLAFQEVLLLHAVDVEFQQKIRKAFDSTKGDLTAYEPHRRKVCLETSAQLLDRIGVEISWEGMCWIGSTYIKAMGNDIYKSEDQLKRQIIMKWSQWPNYQRMTKFKTAEMRDWVISLRDPEGAFAEAVWGGMVGRWHFDEGHLEIVPVNSKLRVVFVADGQVSRGDLFTDDVWHRALLSNGVAIRLRRSDSYMQLLMSLEGACGWLDECVAHTLDDGELASCHVLQRQAVDAVRMLAKTWTVEDAAPPEDAELSDLVPKPLGQLSCSACDKRQGLLVTCMRLVQAHLKTGATQLVYASSVGLWFDWWVIESLFAKGFRFASVHFIDARYDDLLLRDSSMRVSALGDMAAWCRAVGIRSFAHESLAAFKKRHGDGAHLLVQGQDSDPEEACFALHDDGLLVSSSAWKREYGELVEL